MGNSEVTRTNFLVVIYKNFETYEGIRKVLEETPNLKFEVYESVERVFESLRQDQLANILTSNEQKTEVVEYMIRHHLTSTRLYVLTFSADISQQDYDNVYIASISNDIRKLLHHLQNNTQTELYMPLLKLNRALQRKINIKLVLSDEKPDKMRELIARMEAHRLSFEVYPDAHLFEDSVMVSVSDYIVSGTRELRAVCEIVRKKFKNAKVVHFANVVLDLANPFGEFVMASESNFQRILEDIAHNDNKIGSRIEPIKRLHVFLRRSSTQDPKKEAGIQALNDMIVELNGKSANHMQLVFHSDLDNLLEAVRAESGNVATLFLRWRSNEVNTFKRYLSDKHLENRVLVIVLRSETFKEKLEEYADMPKFFFVQPRVVRSIDWINRSIHKEYFDVHKRELLINNIKTVEFTELKHYSRAIEEENYSPSFYVMCTASMVDRLEQYLLKRYADNLSICPQIICFDSREHVLTVRKKRVFMRNDIFAMANSNVKEIIEEVKKHPHEYLVTDGVQAKKQMRAYREVKDTFVALKSHFFRFETSAFATLQYESLYREEVSFLRFDSSFGEEAKIGLFLERFVKLWVMRFNPVRDFQMLKDELLRSLMMCLRCRVLRVKDRDFEEQYTRKVEACTTLCQLARTCIYLYSLPHGFSEVLNRLLSEFQDNIRLLRVLCPFMFCLLLNFCNFFETRSLQSRKLKIYLDGDVDESLLAPGNVVYNTNFFNCINFNEYNVSTKNYILVEYQCVPLREKSFLSSLLFIEPYSFYKEAVEYIFAPFSRFVVKGVRRVGGVKVVQLRCEERTDLIRLFLEQTLDSNDLLKTLKEAIDSGTNALVKVEDKPSKQAAIYYQEFLNATKRGLLLTASHKFHMYEQWEIKDSTAKAIREIEKAWLLTLQGEYTAAQKVLQGIPRSIDRYLLNHVANIRRVIQEVCERRSNIFEKVLRANCWGVHYRGGNEGAPENNQPFQIVPVVMKWKCRYLHEQEEFTIGKQSSRLENMYDRERLTFGQDQSLFVIYREQPKVFIVFDAEQKRALESTLALARNQLQGQSFAARALLFGGMMASDKPDVSIFNEEQNRRIQMKAQNRFSKRESPQRKKPSLQDKRVSGEEIIDDILAGRHYEELTNSPDKASLQLLEEPPKPSPSKEEFGSELEPTCKWFCMYVNGSFRMTPENQKKRPRVKKFKQKSFVFLT